MKPPSDRELGTCASSEAEILTLLVVCCEQIYYLQKTLCRTDSLTDHFYFLEKSLLSGSARVFEDPEGAELLALSGAECTTPTGIQHIDTVGMIMLPLACWYSALLQSCPPALWRQDFTDLLLVLWCQRISPCLYWDLQRWKFSGLSGLNQLPVVITLELDSHLGKSIAGFPVSLDDLPQTKGMW